MNKRPRNAVLNTIEAAGAQVLSDTNGWGIVKTSAGNELLLGKFPVGKIARVDSIDPVSEVTQMIAIGAGTSAETIVANTRYKIEIGNPEQKYETHYQQPKKFATTAPAVLSGNAATDRANIYTILANKVNAYTQGNSTAYTLTTVDYTLGTSVGDATEAFIIGETVTQQTSTETAKVAKFTITSGTFAGDNAAGKLWLYDISDVDSWLATAVTLSAAGTVAGVSTNLVVTQTNATTVHATGLLIVDKAGYFTSSIDRAGKNWVGATQGWTVAVTDEFRTGVYSVGIGSEMLAQIPTYDHSKQDAQYGKLEYELQAGDIFDAAKTYRTYKFTLIDGDEDARAGEQQNTASSNINLYVDFADGDLGDFDTAIGNLT